MNIKIWNIEDETGYKPMYTFYEDLSIAEMFGLDAVKETYDEIMKSWSKEYKALTEFVMALNWKTWEHADKEGRCSSKICELYINLFEEAQNYAYENLKGDELKYFMEVTD